MNDEARLLFTIWEAVSEVLPMSERQEAAAGIIRALIEQGSCDIDLLHDAEGECTYLDRALAEVASENADPDEYLDYGDEE